MVNNLFTQLLAVSLGSAGLILLLRLAMPWLRRRYTAKWQCFIWLLLAIRLLIPLTAVVPAITWNDSPAQIIREQEPIRYQIVDPDETQVPPLPTTSKVLSPAAPVQLAKLFWLAGMMIYGMVQVFFYLQFTLRSRRWSTAAAEPLQTRWQATAKILSLRNTPELLVCPAVDTPLLVGGNHVRLLLPHENFSTMELDCIFRHELTHYRRGDLWYKLLLTLVNGVHWFNPFVYLLVSEAGKALEIACDEEVARNMDEHARMLYGNSILNALPRQKRRNAILTTSFGSAKATMKLRLSALFDHRSKRRGLAAFAMVAVIAGLLGGTMTPVSAASVTPVLQFPSPGWMPVKCAASAVSPLRKGPTSPMMSIAVAALVCL